MQGITIQPKQGQASKLLNWLAAVWCLLLFSSLILLYGDWNFDDPFITYRYAQNLANGQGLVYNPDERILSTTSPLLALLLAPVEQLGFPSPRAATLLGSLALSIAAFVLWRLGQLWHTPLTGAVAMLIFPFLPYVRASIGGEMPLLVMFGLLALLAYTRHHYPATGLLLALATLTRADGSLVAVVLAMHMLFIRRDIPWPGILAYGIPLAAWYGWAWWYYGTPLPATLAAKQAQARMAISQTFLEGGVRLLSTMAHKMTLLLNGELIWKDGIPQVEGVSARSDGIYIPVRSGFYDLHVQQECYSIFLPLTLR